MFEANFVSMKQQQNTTKSIAHQYHRVEHPQVIQMSYDSLKFGWNFYVDVLVETWLKTALIWQRWPIVASYSGCIIPQLFFSPFQLLCFSLQFFLSSLQYTIITTSTLNIFDILVSFNEYLYTTICLT